MKTRSWTRRCQARLRPLDNARQRPNFRFGSAKRALHRGALPGCERAAPPWKTPGLTKRRHKLTTGRCRRDTVPGGVCSKGGDAHDPCSLGSLPCLEQSAGHDEPALRRHRRRARSAHVGRGDGRFTLPASADSGAIRAEYKHGVLLITAPKKEAAKPKQITVKAA